jgi:hypothetical protein
VPRKRVTQFVALMVAVLLAGQSALAEGPCLQGLHSGCRQVAACCISATYSSGSQYMTDCHGSMRSESTALERNQGGCNMAAGQDRRAEVTQDRRLCLNRLSSVSVDKLAAAPVIPHLCNLYLSGMKR